jgi:hypothetical protein
MVVAEWDDGIQTVVPTRELNYNQDATVTVDLRAPRGPDEECRQRRSQGNERRAAQPGREEASSILH